MQNGLNESFWDGLGVEIGPCANFDPKTLFWGTANNYGDWMFGVPHPMKLVHSQSIRLSKKLKVSKHHFFCEDSKKHEFCAWPTLEVLGVPENLVHSIRILEAPAVFLARRWRRCQRRLAFGCFIRIPCAK